VTALLLIRRETLYCVIKRAVSNRAVSNLWILFLIEVSAHGSILKTFQGKLIDCILYPQIHFRNPRACRLISDSFDQDFAKIYGDFLLDI